MAEGSLEGKLVRLTHEKVDPFPDGSATIAVELHEKAGKDVWKELPNKTILFFLDGSADPTDQKDTNEQGRASTEVRCSSPGKHRVTVKVSGAGWYETVPIVMPEPKGKKATDLRVYFSGSRGQQLLTIIVAGENGLRIPGFEVEISEGGIVKLHNSDNPYQMNFNDQKRLVRILAGNAKCLRWENILLGPKPPKQT